MVCKALTIGFMCIAVASAETRIEPLARPSIKGVLPEPGYKMVVHLKTGDQDLVAFIQQNGGPQKASADVIRLWRDGKIESIPDSSRAANEDPSPCLQAQLNLQQEQSGLVIYQTFAYGLSVLCFSTGGPAVNPGVCGIALAAQGIVLWGQYQINQAQQAVRQACSNGF